MATNTSTGNNQYDVTLVGEGMNGLSATYRIFTLQVSTTVFTVEARGRVGGRIWSIPFDKKQIRPGGTLEGKRNIDLGARTQFCDARVYGVRKLVPPEETGELAGRVFGTIFSWLLAFHQGHDGSTTVVPETMSVKDGILAEGSPIYDGESRPIDGAAINENLRTALMLSRSFQAWTEGGDGILVREYGQMVDWLKAEIQCLVWVFRLKAPVAAVELVEGEEEEERSVKISTRWVEAIPEVMHAEQTSNFHAPYTLLTLPLGVLNKPYNDSVWTYSTKSCLYTKRREDDPTRLLGPTGGRILDHGMFKGAFPPRTPEWLEQNPQALMVFDLHAQCGILALRVFVAGELGDVAETCTDAQTTEWVTIVVQHWLGGLMRKATDEGDNVKTEGGGVPRPV
ncbi:hypothetical protein M408DRAFT_22680 [Serendipita vermifera MAFF 305830]|uniref:Amine oxidase domain-containing protein n=1 Tax=Serendipita vermifera MAFF 305830 TaxID=933852 RepID=A0A0C3BCF9_SERVB|nr:hypothetical protein M408DRAFT_22680 [Serendipita vermifera MAFF 305830]